MGIPLPAQCIGAGSGVDMDCLLFHPQVGMGGGNQYLARFPNTKDLMAAYDVVFLGDVGIQPGQLSEQDAELIHGLVEQQSTGLVLMPGERGSHAHLDRQPSGGSDSVQLDLNQSEG